MPSAPFTAFNEQLAILQRTAITAQVTERGAKTDGCNQLIDSGMPTVDDPLSRPQVCMGIGQHAYLTTAENLITLYILTTCFSRILQLR
jgi:hypothetical protein